MGASAPFLLMTKTFIRDTCPHFPGGVPKEHESCDAKIVLVGEAPGKNEAKYGIPFVGEAGRLLFGQGSVYPGGLAKSAGIERNQAYITNVVPFRPRGNKLETVSEADMGRSIIRLRTKLHNRLSPNLIVCLGGTALSAVTGNKGIMKWRGSILQTPFGKVIATVHPAAILRQYARIKTALYDWKRIAEESKSPFVTHVSRRLVCVRNDLSNLNSFDVDRLRRSERLAIDIETSRETQQLLCVAFATGPNESFSIDCRKGIPALVKELCENDAIKILQNGMFDSYVLRIQGVKLSNFKLDTSLLHHAFDNNVGPQAEGKGLIKPYSLAYMASVFTREPYWKDSAKDDNTGESHGAWKHSWRRFQEYNARDAAVTFEISDVLEEKLREQGRLDWYHKHYSSLLTPLLAMSHHGVQFNSASAASEVEKLTTEQRDIRVHLGKIHPPLIVRHIFKKQPKVIGERKDGKVIGPEEAAERYRIQAWVKEGKSISNQALQEFLRKKLRLRVTRFGTDSSDEVALREMLITVKEEERTWPTQRILTAPQTINLLTKVLRFRKLESTLKFLQAKKVDTDGRFRSMYSMLIQTGRLSSSANPLGTGMNLQNIARHVRHFFVPDNSNWYFLSCDLKQAEDLVVKTLSQDERALALVREVQAGTLDLHKRLAVSVFQVAAEAITYGQRQTSKKARHARNYDMQAKTFQQGLLKDGFVFTLGECKRILDAVDSAEPWVLGFQREIRRAIMEHKRLETSWGWSLDFSYERLRDSGVFRRGYALIPQSEVGVLMKQWGLKEMYGYIHKRGLEARINLLVHDDLTLSCPRSELYVVASRLSRSLERARLIKVRSEAGDEGAIPLSIPAEITIAKTLKCTCGSCNKPLEFGKLPDRKSFYEALDKWEAGLRQ